MKNKQSFVELVVHICLRPGMYTPSGNFREVYCYLSGYSTDRETPLGNESHRTFSSFVCIKYGWPTNYAGFVPIEESAVDDKDAIRLLKDNILEYLELAEKYTPDQLLEYAYQTYTKPESDATQVFRLFQTSLLDGDVEILKSVILPHSEAEILWESTYPKDVAAMLLFIAESQPIKVLGDPEKDTRVEVISAHFPHPIEMKLVNKEWKVDAQKVIELELSRKKKDKGD